MIAKTRLTTTTTGNHPAPPPLNCPRCDSPNTKFCYYNNYSLSQPRHFCKSCKRYWTRGGTLRNVPVGGSSRKNKRAKKHPISTTPTLPPPPQLIHPTSADFNSLFYPPFKFDLELDGKYCYGAQSIIPNNNNNLVELPKSTQTHHNPWDEFPIEIPVTATAAAAESSYVYWNQAGWPETGGSSSMASLF